MVSKLVETALIDTEGLNILGDNRGDPATGKVYIDELNEIKTRLSDICAQINSLSLEPGDAVIKQYSELERRTHLSLRKAKQIAGCDITKSAVAHDGLSGTKSVELPKIDVVELIMSPPSTPQGPHQSTGMCLS